MESGEHNLEVENRKLKAKQAELTTKFCDEREMVKYLHSVIKNYESLLRHEPDSPRTRKRSGQLSFSPRKTETAMENPVKAGKNLVKLKEFLSPIDRVRPEQDEIDMEEKDRSLIEFQQRIRAHETKVPLSLMYSSPDEVSSSEGEMLNASGLESDLDSSFEISDDFKHNRSEKEEQKFEAANLVCPPFTEQRYQVTKDKQGNFDTLRRPTLEEMKQLVDAMLKKANKYEKRVRRKEAEMKRLEIKLEYLESIAFGEESECL